MENAPNILHFLVDDMPEKFLDVLERALPLFDYRARRFYAALPVCVGDRAAYWDGTFPHNNGVRFNDGGSENFRRRGHDGRTVAAVLRQNGYRTGLMGKWLNGYEDHPYELPGFDRQVVVMGNADPVEGRIDGDIRRPLIDPDTGNPLRIERETVYLFDRGEAFAGAGGRPWFLTLSVKAPHSPYAPSGANAGSHAGEPIERLPNFDEDLSDKPPSVRRGPLTGEEVREIRRAEIGKKEELEDVEDGILRLFRMLSETGQLANTWVFFTSDNGWDSGSHRGLSKGKPWDESSRLPFLATGPGCVAGEGFALASMVDLAPTFCEIAGVAPPARYDGRSLLPLLTGRAPDTGRRRLLVEGWDWRMVREISPDASGVARDVCYVERGPGAADGVEFYDMAADPWQMDSDPRLATEADRRNLAELASTGADALRAAEERP